MREEKRLVGFGPSDDLAFEEEAVAVVVAAVAEWSGDEAIALVANKPRAEARTDEEIAC